ncbi:MAG: hypothetical protein HYX81_04760 [Chloroflexi bacterium]|nr:hypothetical protein [Chloroflexota bacterium]
MSATFDPGKPDTAAKWRRTARGRLKFELAGIAFALKHGLTPEDYARHLWSTGAMKWIDAGNPAFKSTGKVIPTVREYILKEAEAFQTLYPEVVFELSVLDDDEAELTFTRGCLGGWGTDQWAIARSLGLSKKDVCRYCQQAFRSWSEQLGLEACPEPDNLGTCVLRAKREN